jgi:hypothetical protein
MVAHVAPWWREREPLYGYVATAAMSMRHGPVAGKTARGHGSSAGERGGWLVDDGRMERYGVPSISSAQAAYFSTCQRRSRPSSRV